MRQLVIHHDGLRQRFSYDGGIVRARIVDTSAAVPFDQHDLSGLTDEAQAREIERIGSRAQAALDIARGPVIRAVLFELGGGKPSRLMVVVHHLAVDGVSFRILLEDFQAACRQLGQGSAVALPSKTTSVKAWALRLHEQAGSAAVAGEADYWRGVLRAAPARLPADFPAEGARGRNDLASARTVSAALGPAETTALLREVPSAYNTQINDVLLAALSRVLTEWTGSAASLVELESHGREPLFPDLDLSRTVGWVTATYPVALETDLTGAPAGTLKATKERLRAVPNGGIGYGLLRYGGPAAGDIANYPEPEVSFNYLGQFDQSFRGAEAFTLAPEEIGPRESPGNSRTHLLGIVGEIMDGQLRIHWTYSENVHRAATIQRLSDGYIAELRALIEHCVSKEAREYTPSDFPRARLSQSDLDKFIQQITISE
jgi:non-ribosomal peptide synthase protein (TIGR01720 family)